MTNGTDIELSLNGDPFAICEERELPIGKEWSTTIEVPQAETYKLYLIRNGFMYLRNEKAKIRIGIDGIEELKEALNNDGLQSGYKHGSLLDIEVE